MKSFKVWLLRWLGAVSVAEFYHVRAGDSQALRDEFRGALFQMKSDYEAAITELIQELNNVRNSIPAALTQSARPPVRVFRNFREFRTIMEGASKKIPIERNS